MTEVAEKFSETDLLASEGDGGAGQRVLAEIGRLGLERNAWELDVRGYTVLTPAQVAGDGLAERLRDRILEASEQATGVKPDLEQGRVDTLTKLGRGQILPNVLFSDPAFEQALMTPTVLALMTYLLGESCILVAMNGVIKAPGPEQVPLHSDCGQPSPLPPYAQVANATWLLTDFNVENGATCFEAGSHKRCRNPTVEEATDLSATVPLIAPAGSVVIWHGNTWHAARARTAAGLRVSLLTFFSRHYVRSPRETFEENATPEMLDRNPDRFAQLLGLKTVDPVTGYRVRHSVFA